MAAATKSEAGSGKGLRCSAKTGRGRRCKRAAVAGLEVCGQHASTTAGRPSKLTPETTAAIVEVLEFGGYLEAAAAAAGIGRSTLKEWLRRGDPEGTASADASFRVFAATVEQAKAKGEVAAVATITRAAKSDWKAAAWMLERQHPDRWAGPRGRAADRSTRPPIGEELAEGGRPLLRLVDDQVSADGRAL